MGFTVVSEFRFFWLSVGTKQISRIFHVTSKMFSFSFPHYILLLSFLLPQIGTLLDHRTLYGSRLESFLLGTRYSSRSGFGWFVRVIMIK